MRGSTIIEKILEILQRSAEASVGILDAITPGDTYRKLKRMSYRPPHFKTNWAETFRDRQKFYSLLNYLKKGGLVEAKKEKGRALWKITAAGSKKLKLLKERNRYSKESASYRKSPEGTNMKIIAYDIPSAGNDRKRTWLRWALLNMGFTMLQRSVWVGKKNVPEEFLRDLHERRLLPHVQIFEIAKEGTLKKVS